MIDILQWVRIEEFTRLSWCGVGHPPFERAWLANAFVAKGGAGGDDDGGGLLDRLINDRKARRICGFPPCRALPSEATLIRNDRPCTVIRYEQLAKFKTWFHSEAIRVPVPVALRAGRTG